MKQKAVVLVSGGMDSCVTAAIANEKYDPAFLHVNYGQRTEERELRSFDEIADFYKVRERLVANIEYLKLIGGSALTDENIPVPEAAVPNSAIRILQSAIATPTARRARAMHSS